MKSTLLSGMLLLGSFACLKAQTVTFKPGPGVAQDANMWMLDGACTPTGLSQTPADVNFGSDPIFGYSAWTWYGAGCSTGYTRSLIRFDELATIPSTATITHAELRLYGLPSSYVSMTWGNNYFPGTPLPNPNDGELYQVDYTQPQWDQSTVTWNTQPGTISSPVSIPVTTSQWDWNTSLDVTAMVSDMVNNPAHNHGFLMQLQNPAYYRGVNFATSENSDPTLWPELVVTYCDPGFSYTVDAGNPYDVTFNAHSTTALDYQWYVDGNYAGNTATLANYSFPGPGTYKVCLTVVSDKEHKCDKCIALCLSDNGKPQDPKNKAAGSTTKNSLVARGSVARMDEVTFRVVKVSPNPAHKGWNVSLNAIADGDAQVTIYDVTGKKISSRSQKLVKGSNNLYQSAEGLANGTYLLEVASGDKVIHEKLVRE